MSEASSPAPPERPLLPTAFFALLAVLAATVAPFLPAGLAAAIQTPGEALVWVAFISAAALLTVPMDRRLRVEITLSAPAIVAAAVVLPAGLATLVTLLAVSSAREFGHGTSRWLSLFNRLQFALGAGLAAIAATALAGGGNMLAGRVAAAAFAAVVYNLVNTLAIAVYLRVRGIVPVREAARRTFLPHPRFAVDWALITGLALLIVALHDSHGLWAVPLLGVPMWLGFNALAAARQAEDRAASLEAASAEIARRNRALETLNDLATRLLTCEDPGQAADTANDALRLTVGAGATVVLDNGERPSGRVVPVPGSATAALVVAEHLDPAEHAVVDAVAVLLGLTLQRQQLEAGRLKLERELARTEQARAALSVQLLEGVTQERIRISLELHDDVLPLFTAAGQHSDLAALALSQGRTDEALQLLESGTRHVDGGIRAAREMLDELRKQTLAPGGLRQALVSALDELTVEHGLAAELHAPEPLPSFAYPVELLVLDTVRSLLANTVAHAHARRVDVVLTCRPDSVAVEVVDDGQGFDPGAVEAGRHGLALISTRAKVSRGDLSIDSRLGAGTTVRLEIPR